MRASASRGEFACTVESEPSWPVFIAWSMSSASAPRHLADDDPVGAHAQRVADEVADRDLRPRPRCSAGAPRAGARAAGASWSSAASSIVTIRSLFGIADESAFRSVVLPEPVPPEMRMLQLRLDAAPRGSRPTPRDSEPMLIMSSSAEALARLNFRIVSSGPGERERRDDRVDAAAVGKARVDHRRRLVDAAADLRDDLVDDAAQVRLVGEADGRLVERAPALDPDLVRAVDHDLRDRVVGEQALERPVAEDVVGDLAREALAVVARDARSRSCRCRRMSAVTRSRSSSGSMATVEELRAELADHAHVDRGS